ncbi:hypothetical protein GOBAR_AA02878 [Gossypium barbadense]|uniref:Uncharacterized protein n=1 Tax=Gossypium barbadense TaxID=3634 RepID=A0A2P5YQ28_GOSBA|nr:hypothetical protein GOBAR_AA02878 [Gossypium barbadense]
MAASLALPYAAGIPASARQQRRRSMVIKAQKTSIMANHLQYNTMKKPVALVPYHAILLHSLHSIPDGTTQWWLDKEIKDGHTNVFLQKADLGSSIGGLEYVFPEDAYKWVIAWSNARNDLNKLVITYMHVVEVSSHARHTAHADSST